MGPEEVPPCLIPLVFLVEKLAVVSEMFRECWEENLQRLGFARSKRSGFPRAHYCCPAGRSPQPCEGEGERYRAWYLDERLAAVRVRKKARSEPGLEDALVRGPRVARSETHGVARERGLLVQPDKVSAPAPATTRQSRCPNDEIIGHTRNADQVGRGVCPKA